MHADDMKRLDELKALADNSDKRQKFLMESFGVARELGRHFEHMNGSPQLKRMANLMADWFALQAIGLNRITSDSATSPAILSPASQRLVDLANNAPAELKADIVIGPEAIAKALGEPIPPKPEPTLGSANMADAVRPTNLAEAVAIARGNPEPPTQPIRFASEATDHCRTHCERGDGIACPEDSCDIDDGLVKPAAATVAAPAKKAKASKPEPPPVDENLF